MNEEFRTSVHLMDFAVTGSILKAEAEISAYSNGWEGVRKQECKNYTSVSSALRAHCLLNRLSTKTHIAQST